MTFRTVTILKDTTFPDSHHPKRQLFGTITILRETTQNQTAPFQEGRLGAYFLIHLLLDLPFVVRMRPTAKLLLRWMQGSTLIFYAKTISSMDWIAHYIMCIVQSRRLESCGNPWIENTRWRCRNEEIRCGQIP